MAARGCFPPVSPLCRPPARVAMRFHPAPKRMNTKARRHIARGPFRVRNAHQPRDRESSKMVVENPRKWSLKILENGRCRCKHGVPCELGIPGEGLMRMVEKAGRDAAALLSEQAPARCSFASGDAAGRCGGRLVGVAVLSSAGSRRTRGRRPTWASWPCRRCSPCRRCR